MAGILDDFPLTVGDVASIDSAAQKLSESFMACRFDWAGHTGISCSAEKHRSGSELDVGGWRKTQHCRITVRMTVLAELGVDLDEIPRTNDVVKLYLSADGPVHQLRVLWVENRHDQVLEIELVESNHPGL